jgi:hypothetical protein
MAAWLMERIGISHDKTNKAQEAARAAQTSAQNGKVLMLNYGWIADSSGWRKFSQLFNTDSIGGTTRFHSA